MFLALVRVWEAEPVPEIDAWAKEILGEERRVQELGENWTRPTSSEWAASGKIGRLLEPMRAHLSAAGGAEFLEQARKAMQELLLPGQVDGLTVGNLKYYLKEKPVEWDATKPKKGFRGCARWQGVALVGVAALVKRHGAELSAGYKPEPRITR